MRKTDPRFKARLDGRATQMPVLEGSAADGVELGIWTRDRT